MNLQKYGIIEPISLNWRLVAPRDFSTLEYFITPDLSLVFNRITSGVNDGLFAVGREIMDKPNPELFKTEYMARRSRERIEKAFDDERISVFFTLQEMDMLSKMFESFRYQCTDIEIYRNGLPITSVYALPKHDLLKVWDALTELRAYGITSFEEVGKPLEEKINKDREEARRAVKEEESARKYKEAGITKPALVKKGFVSGLLITASILSAFGSKALIKTKSVLGLIGGVVLGLFSVLTGSFGKKLADESVEHLRRGMIWDV